MEKLKAFLETKMHYWIVRRLFELHARIFLKAYYTRAEVEELIKEREQLELCTIHFYYTAKGVIGATKTPKIESVFAWINLARSTKEDCIHLFRLPGVSNSRVTINEVVIIPVPKVKYSR